MNKIKKSILFIIILCVLGSAFSPVITSTSYQKKTWLQQNNAGIGPLVNTGGDGTTDYYAIIATCGRYLDPSANLPIGMAQQRYLYQSLLTAPNWHAKNIIFLVNDLPDINDVNTYNGGATRENILKALDEMAVTIDEDDVFLFAWLGHGSRVPDDDGDEKTILKPFDRYDEVICPFDCYYDDNKTLLNFIRDDELDTKFSNIKAKGMCLIFESCFSGGLVEQDALAEFDENTNGFIDPAETEIFQQDFSFDLKEKATTDIDKPGRIVLMASIDDCVARLAPILGGPLTTSMALGFLGSFKGDKKDINTNSFLSVEEAFQWAQPRAFCISSGYYLMFWMYFISMTYFSTNHTGVENPLLESIINGSKMFFSEIILIQIIVRMRSGVWAATFPHMYDGYHTEGGLDIIQLKNHDAEEVISTLYLPESLGSTHLTQKEYQELMQYLKQNTSFMDWSDEEISAWMPKLDEFVQTSWDDIPVSYKPGFFASIEHSFTPDNTKEIHLSSFLLGGHPPYTFEWDFGDGNKVYGRNVTHSYEKKGEYTISLSVYDKKHQLADDLTNPFSHPKIDIQVHGEKNKSLADLWNRSSFFKTWFYPFCDTFLAKLR